MQISVMGCGHVGLVTAGGLAALAHRVICADKDPTLIRTLKSGQLPFYEPHLDAVVASGLREGLLRFTEDPAEAVRASDVIFICVGIPLLENGDADLSAWDNLARLIAAHSSSPKLVVERSTVPAQTGEKLMQLLSVYGRRPKAKFRVAANPHFPREGTAVEDFLHPSHILLGIEDSQAEQQLREIYRPILERRFHCPVHGTPCPPRETPEVLVMSMKSAELTKYASNAFLAMKISYANVLGDLCERLEADIEEVTRAMGLDPRIGPRFLKAGLGFGGFRLPRDVKALNRLAGRVGLDCGMLQETDSINRHRIELFLEKIRRAVWVIKGKRIAALGLAYKPHTDDIRFSPAIELIQRLSAEGAEVLAYDPAAMGKARLSHPELRCAADPYEASQGADAILITTEWQEFRQLDWKRIRDAMARPLVLDGRNLLEPAQMKAFGIEYHSIGRPR